MATRKITSNQLRTLVRNIIKEEQEESIRKQLHTLVGAARRAEKRADNFGGMGKHAEEYEKAEKELQMFLRQNPEMLDYLDEVEDHFYRMLYKR